MFQVVCSVDFSYAHRLFNYVGKCGNIHGHNGVAQVFLKTQNLDSSGMVKDFVDIKRKTKLLIDETIDHKLLLSKHDSIVPYLKQSQEVFYLMDENPTAENIAKLLYHLLLSSGLGVYKIKLWETSDLSVIYTEDE